MVWAQELSCPSGTAEPSLLSSHTSSGRLRGVSRRVQQLRPAEAPSVLQPVPERAAGTHATLGAVLPGGRLIRELILYAVVW